MLAWIMELQTCKYRAQLTLLKSNCLDAQIGSSHTLHVAAPFEANTIQLIRLLSQSFAVLPVILYHGTMHESLQSVPKIQNEKIKYTVNAKIKSSNSF